MLRPGCGDLAGGLCMTPDFLGVENFEGVEMVEGIEKAKRIYLVENCGQQRLIAAESKGAALSYAVKTSVKVELASQEDLVALVKDGVEVERSDGE